MAISHLLSIVLLVSRPAGWMFGPILFAIGFIHSPNRLTTRPKTILLQLFSLSFPLALGTLLRSSCDFPAVYLSAHGFRLTVVFGVNDVYDYPSDRRNPRKLADALEGTVLPPEHHAAVLYAAWAATVTIVSVSGLLFLRHNFAVVVALLLLSWQYSAPPLRFKERPILDSLSNGAIVDLTYLAGYTAGGGLLDERVLRVRGHVLALCTAGVHALGAAVDADVDAAAGQRTIATVFGGRAAVVFAGAS